jgi:hypothetical protein
VLCLDPDPALPLEDPGLSLPGLCNNFSKKTNNKRPQTHLCHVDTLVLLQAKLVVVVHRRLVREHGPWGRLSRERESRRRKNRAGRLASAAADRASIIRMVV